MLSPSRLRLREQFVEGSLELGTYFVYSMMAIINIEFINTG
jgi:hypothetical protein